MKIGDIVQHNWFPRLIGPITFIGEKHLAFWPSVSPKPLFVAITRVFKI